ncbi:MAG: hypothetical protein R3Y26_02030 [Rikenellaceae bacterium]
MKFNKSHIPLAIITIVFTIVYIFCFDAKPDVNGDNAQYVRLAQNLANGLGYSNVTPSGITPASHYPPGYAAFLAIVSLMGGANLILFKVLNGVFMLCSLLLLFYVVKQVTENWKLALLVALLPIFSTRLINFSFMIMSEMSYMFMTVLALYALYKESERETDKLVFWKSTYFYVAIVAAVASYYIRTVGISAIFAVLVFYAFRKEWKQLLASAAGVVLLLLPWSIRNSIHGIESRYMGTVMTVNPWRPEEGTISSFGEMIEKMVTNFDDTVIKGFRFSLFPILGADFKTPSDTMMIIVGLIILAIVIWGAWKMGKLRYYMLAFLIANIGLFMLWHGGNQERYVIPIIPYIFVCFFVGLYKLTTLKFKYSPLLLLLFILPMVPFIMQRREISQKPYSPGYDSYFRAVNMLKKIPKGAVVCCRKPEFLVFYASNAIGTNYLYSLDTEEVIRDLVEKNVDIVILDNMGFASTVRYLYPAIKAHDDLFVPVHETEGEPITYIIQFDRKKAMEQGF